MASLQRIRLYALVFCTFCAVSTDLPKVSAAYLNGCLAYNVWGVPLHDCRLAHVEAKFMSTILRLQQNLSRAAGSQDHEQVLKKIGHSGSTITFSLAKVGALLRPRPDADSLEGRCPPRDDWEGALVSDKVGVRICKERLMCCDAVTAPGLNPFIFNLFTCQVRCLLAVKVTIKLDVMETAARAANFSEYKSCPATNEARCTCGESQGSADHNRHEHYQVKGAEDDRNFPDEVEDCATCLETYGSGEGCCSSASPPFAEGENEQDEGEEESVIDPHGATDLDGWDEGEDFPTYSEWDYPGYGTVEDGPEEGPNLGGDVLDGEPAETDPDAYGAADGWDEGQKFPTYSPWDYPGYGAADGWDEGEIFPPYSQWDYPGYGAVEDAYGPEEGPDLGGDALEGEPAETEDFEQDDLESEEYSQGDSPDAGGDDLAAVVEQAGKEDSKENDVEEGSDLGGDGLEEDQTEDEDSDEGSHPSSSPPGASSTRTPSPSSVPSPSTRAPAPSPEPSPSTHTPSPSPEPSASALTPSPSPEPSASALTPSPSPSPSPEPSASALTPFSSPNPSRPPSRSQGQPATAAFTTSSGDSAIAGSVGEGPPGASSAAAFSFNTAASS